jgi:hypothetical protein
MKTLLALCAVAASSLCFGQDHFRFIVTGDDRWDTSGGRAGDENGVNVAGLTRVMAAVMAEKPVILLMNGDTVGGMKNDDDEYSQFQTYLRVMKPVYDSGIKVLTIRGNHEMHSTNASAVWRKVFVGEYANPEGGPPGEEQETFEYKYGNTLFLGLDEFVTNEATINQPWVDSVLAKEHATHIVAFAHKMAFKSGHHVDGMNSVPEARDKFLESLINAGSRMIFFGHDHLYDHEFAVEDGQPDANGIHQVVVGTAGAPFVHGRNDEPTDGKWKLTHLGHVEGKLGYCVVDIDGKKATVTFKAESSPGKFETADSFVVQAAG